MAGVGPDLSVLGATVARAQVTMGIDQTAYFTPESIIGDLVYTNRDTGIQRMVPFDLMNPVLDVNLDLPGIWDFSFENVDVNSLFDTSIGGSLALDVDLIGVISKHFPFANLHLLDTPSFALDFAALDVPTGFSIAVIPEPSTGLLFGMGLAGLALCGRPRSTAPRA